MVKYSYSYFEHRDMSNSKFVIPGVNESVRFSEHFSGTWRGNLNYWMGGMQGCKGLWGWWG
jgi:hypothetical protein